MNRESDTSPRQPSSLMQDDKESASHGKSSHGISFKKLLPNKLAWGKQNKKLVIFLFIVFISIIALVLSLLVVFPASKQAAEFERLKTDLSSGDPEKVASAWLDLAENKDDEKYDAFANSQGGYPTSYQITKLWEMGEGYKRYLESYYNSHFDLRPSLGESLTNTGYHYLAQFEDDDSYRKHFIVLVEDDIDEYMDLELLANKAGMNDQIGREKVIQQYAHSSGSGSQHTYEFIYGQTTLDGEEAASIAFSDKDPYDMKHSKPGWRALICTPLGDRSIDSVISVLKLYCENAAANNRCDLRIITRSVSCINPKTADDFASFPHSDFGSATETPEQEEEHVDTGEKKTEADANNAFKDKALVNEPGKSIYQIYAKDGTLGIKGDYSGSGNFIVRILNSNQGHYKLVANEIGSYVLDTEIPVEIGSKYYLLVECSDGSWNLEWTGTYGF